MYYQCIHDNFSVFKNKEAWNEFLTHLNSSNCSLCFTFKKESPFLDILVEKSNSYFITSVYKKPTLTGMYVGILLASRSEK